MMQRSRSFSSIMMKTHLLLSFCLSGWLTFSTCLHHHYHYVAEGKTWHDAQTYCREKFTDLATIDDITDMKQFVAIASPGTYVWTGMYNLVNWTWSLADASYYTDNGTDYRNWETQTDDEPDFYNAYQFCVFTDNNGRWYDYHCARLLPFICYNGTSENPSFIFVNENRNWSSAQQYCRENYIDLASVRNNEETSMIQNVMLSRRSAWIGLFRDPGMFWSDGSDSSFQYWRSGFHPFGSWNIICAAADLPDSGKWRALSCGSMFPFVCYGPLPPVPITRQVVKLEIKSDKPVDLNNAAVKADILRKLQDRLKEAGVSGATLKWREHPDGTVFKEEKSSEKTENEEKNEL